MIMMNTEIKAKVEALAQDTQWLEKLENTQSATEAAAMFQEQGLPVTEEDLLNVAQMSHKQDELNEADLNNVAGGIVFTAGMGIALMLSASVVAYGGAFAMSKFTASWNKKKRK